MPDAATTVCLTLARFSEHARVGLHRGQASVVVDEEEVQGPAEFFLPVEGPPFVALWNERSFVSTPGADLTLVGHHDGHAFRLTCPGCQLHKTMTGQDRGWTLVSPRNHPVRISYGEDTAVESARILLNNFDYEIGDVEESGSGWTRKGTPFTVQLAGRRVEFRRRADYADVLPLVAAGLLRSASLVEVSCEATGTDDEMLAFANDIAALCTFARGGSVGVAMVELWAVDGRVVRRVVPQPVQSRFTQTTVIPDHELQRLFLETFEKHTRMRRDPGLPWHKLPSHCGSLEDLPYLEQKVAALMAAIEFLIRTCLREDGMTADAVTKPSLNDLLGLAKKRLGWNIPSHYNARNLTRDVRNAVAHGSDPPTKDNEELRRLFDKWRLFLHRRILIRLGYAGDIEAPRLGVYESSPVNDFSEARNSFERDQAESHPFVRFVRHLRQRQQSASKAASTSGPSSTGDKE